MIKPGTAERELLPVLFNAFFFFFYTSWCLHYPQCNLATEWHHWRQFINHTTSSGATKCCNTPKDLYTLKCWCIELVELPLRYNTSLNVLSYIPSLPVELDVTAVTCRAPGRLLLVQPSITAAHMGTFSPFFLRHSSLKRRICAHAHASEGLHLVTSSQTDC